MARWLTTASHAASSPAANFWSRFRLAFLPPFCPGRGTSCTVPRRNSAFAADSASPCSSSQSAYTSRVVSSVGSASRCARKVASVYMGGLRGRVENQLPDKKEPDYYTQVRVCPFPLSLPSVLLAHPPP